jgi:hypothetical protein
LRLRGRLVKKHFYPTSTCPGGDQCEHEVDESINEKRRLLEEAIENLVDESFHQSGSHGDNIAIGDAIDAFYEDVRNHAKEV